ncbi:MAG: WG repeat-containing protein [Proteobacteria bacterium]|nr:WG repeat-containing protein [Pseudomonadota bacterium]
MGKKRWAVGLAAAILVIGMGLLVYGLPIHAAETPGSKAEDLAQIKINGKIGYINARGKVVIPPILEDPLVFAANGLARYQGGYINTQGEVVIPARLDEGKAVVTSNGEMALDISSRFEKTGNFAANGLAKVKVRVMDDKLHGAKWGYINAQGEMVIPPKFGWEPGDFAANGLARVDDFISEYDRGPKHGYINAQGEMAIPLQFEYARDFAANGLAAIRGKKGEWGYINAQGEEVIPPRFEEVGNFAANGLARVLARVQNKARWGYINAQGEEVIPPKFVKAWDFAANGLATIEEYKNYGYINTQGEVVIPTSFEKPLVFAANGLAPFKEGEKWGYINTQGKRVVPPRFASAQDFAANGLASVEEDGEYGYINAQGEMVIPPRFQSAGDFAANGLAPVREHGRWGYINAKGERVIPLGFQSAENFAANGVALVTKNGKEVYINTQGQTIVSIDRECGATFLKGGSGMITWQSDDPVHCEENSRSLENATETAKKSGFSFSHGDWTVTCDNTLTCRMEGVNEKEGSVLITRAAGPNAPLHGEVTLADADDDTNDPLPPFLTLLIGGEKKGQLQHPGGESYVYPLTPAQTHALLDAARADKAIEFTGRKQSFVLFGDGLSAVMLKMDDIQGRVGTPGALVRKGKKPEESVRAPIPMPVIRAAKVSDKPVRELTAAEVQAIEPLLWQSRGERCDLHDPERKKEWDNEVKFTLIPLDERYALISTGCEMYAYQGTNAFWIIDSELKKAPQFLMEEIWPEYEKGVLSSSAKGRGIGDCWGGSSWVWDGTEFRLSRQWATGSCSLIHAGGTWNIPTYVTEVRPAE